jgi:calcium-dependent protein kinase
MVQTITKFTEKLLLENSLFPVQVKIIYLGWDKISDKAKDLIKKMLCDASTRYSAQDVLSHAWIKEKESLPQISLSNINVDSLKNYKNNNKLKKAVLTFIASRLKEDEIKSLKDIFNQFDKNHDGTLTLEEMREGIQ